jgi:hypothetical protein
MRKKRVCENEIPYMTPEWKKAVRDKRKYAIQFAKDRSSKNFELKKKYCCTGTKEKL